MTTMIAKLLLWFPSQDLGWKEIGETFVRYDILKTRWFNLYLHYLVAERQHPNCHNHPWWFVTFILCGGYWEFTNDTKWVWRRPLSLLYRPAAWSHNVITHSTGMWSLVLTGPKRHAWGFLSCEG